MGVGRAAAWTAGHAAELRDYLAANYRRNSKEFTEIKEEGRGRQHDTGYQKFLSTLDFFFSVFNGCLAKRRVLEYWGTATAEQVISWMTRAIVHLGIRIHLIK